MAAKPKRAVMEKWVQLALGNQEYLWQLPICWSDNADGMALSKTWLAETLSISMSCVSRNWDLIEPVNTELKKLGLIIAGETPHGCDQRRRLLAWYNKLTVEQKRALPIFGNRIKFRGCLDQLFSRADLRRNDRVFKQALDQIYSELTELGIVDTNYVPVVERPVQKRAYYLVDLKDRSKEWDELGALPLETICDFVKADTNQVQMQFKQLFAFRSKESAKVSTIENFKIGYFHIEQYLNHQSDLADHIEGELHAHFLQLFKSNYLSDLVQRKEMSPTHATGVLSSVRQVLSIAKNILGLDFPFFYDCDGFSDNRVTDSRRPYSITERLRIDEAIKKSIQRFKDLSLPYKCTEQGEYPDSNDPVVFIQKMRWLFENRLGCRVVNYQDRNSGDIEIRKFLSLATDNPLGLGLHEIYERLGVLSELNADVMLPFCLRLAQVTGLNPDSLLLLDIDDFVECHPLSGRPCLRYWKERSTGEREYHLDLFHAKLTWLTGSQSAEVECIFKEVLRLTAPLRPLISGEFKNRLFIYQSNASALYGEVRPFMGKSVVSGAINRFVDAYNIVDDSGQPLNLNISRFRPSFVSELIDRGVSLREIQHILGHKNIQTTIKYLDQNDLNQIARKKVNDALLGLHKDVVRRAKNPGSAVNYENEDKIIFKTPLASCANIFNPPEFVRKLPTYVPGTPCGQYNKCLGCDNVVITVHHLPELFAMRRDYMELSQRNRIMDTPYGAVVSENLDLLDDILNPESSDFSLEQLALAEGLSIYIQTSILVDGVSI